MQKPQSAKNAAPLYNTLYYEVMFEIKAAKTTHVSLINWFGLFRGDYNCKHSPTEGNK